MKKIIDEKGRLFGKISIIDVFVIILVLVLAAAIYMRFFTKNETAVTSEVDFTYQIKVYAVRPTTANNVKAGDKMYSSESGALLGTVTDVEVTDAVIEIEKSDGTFAEAATGDRCDAVITIDGTGIISNGRYFADRSFEIAVNDRVEVCTKYCTFGGYIWSIEK